MKKSNVNKSVKQLHRDFKADKLNFDLAIQRNIVWDLNRKSLLIHSLIYGYPIPPFYALDGEQLHFLDGKQRLKGTIFSYIDGEWDLSPDTPPIHSIEIKGLNFEQLPEEFRDEIESTMLTIYKFEDATDEEIEEMFLRLNNGMSLTAFELTRVQAGSELMDFINSVTALPFFSKINLSASQRNRYQDQELVIHILSVLDGYNMNFSAADIRKYVNELKTSGVPEELKQKVINTIEYLNGIELSDKEAKRIFKKIHIPAICNTVNLGEPVAEFTAKLQQFFANCPTVYSEATKGATGKVANIHTRLKTMQSYIDTCVIQKAEAAATSNDNLEASGQ